MIQDVNSAFYQHSPCRTSAQLLHGRKSGLGRVILPRPLVPSDSPTLLLSAPIVRTSFGARSFSIAVPTVWNSLPLSPRKCASPDTFCRHLKTHHTASRPSNPLNSSLLILTFVFC